MCVSELAILIATLLQVWSELAKAAPKFRLATIGCRLLVVLVSLLFGELAKRVDELAEAALKFKLATVSCRLQLSVSELAILIASLLERAC